MRSKTNKQKVFTTEHIKRLGITRELNAKYEREGFLPPASIEPSSGPWRAALYSEGDIIARVLMKQLTGRGLSLKTASYILWNAGFIGEAFDSGELDDFFYMAFPVLKDTKNLGRGIKGDKVFTDCQPFNEWADLDNFYPLGKHDVIIILNIGKIRESISNLG